MVINFEIDGQVVPRDARRRLSAVSCARCAALGCTIFILNDSVTRIKLLLVPYPMASA